MRQISLIKLVQRLYDVTDGRILWDGTDLRDAQIASLKQQIALVTQETVLFNDTILYNVSYGKPNATEVEIPSSSPRSLLPMTSSRTPEKMGQTIPWSANAGRFFLGGQRQRIAIARAVLADAPVLILDEATALRLC